MKFPIIIAITLVLLVPVNVFAEVFEMSDGKIMTMSMSMNEEVYNVGDKIIIEFKTDNPIIGWYNIHVVFPDGSITEDETVSVGIFEINHVVTEYDNFWTEDKPPGEYTFEIRYLTKIISKQVLYENNSSPSNESDYCTSEELLYGLSFPVEEIIFQYKAATNVAFRDNFSSERFESYLNDVDYENYDRATSYVDSIFSSKEFATFYSDRNLIPEEEKLMIQISEKYLEFLKDGKNRFTLEMDTLYTEKRNEIDAVPMQDSRLTICGDDKIAGLEEFEEVRRATQYMINNNISDTIEDWERNLEQKQSKFPTDYPQKESTQLTNYTIPGEIGLKKGDWVKYKIIFGGEGGFASMMDAMKDAYEIPGLDCKFSEIEWIKTEVNDIKNNQPIMKGSISCDGEEHSVTNTDENIFQNVNQFYIPIDIEIGKTITLSDKEFTVSEPDAKMYGSKTVEVIRLYSEDVELYDNDGKMTTIDESYFEKESGILLEKTMILEAVNVPLFGDMSFTFGLDAIDYNTPRTILSQPTSDSGGGCLIATATYGSELAPQVQQLRELRDHKLMQTQSGQSFMNSFNEFYYSFSPHIADYERENPIFKEAVKITLTPLLTSLSILNHVNLDSEESVLGYGISLIILNIGMYFVAPAMVIVGIRRMT